MQVSVLFWYFRISLNATVPGLYRCGFCVPFLSVFSVERRFQKLDLDPEQLVFDYQPADAVGASNLFHGLSAAKELMDLLELHLKAVACLPS
jgi:hypothetical protein